MAIEYRIRTQALHRFDRLVTELGGDPKALLAGYGLSPQALNSREQTVDISVLVSLLNDSATRLEYPGLGLRLGSMQDFTMLGPLGVLLQNCQTPREAMGATRGFIAFHNQTEYWHYQELPERVVIQRIENFTAISDTRQYKEMAISAFFHLTRLLLTDQLKAIRIEFSHAPLAAVDTYRRVFGCDVHFDCERDSIVLDKAFLDLPIANSQVRIKQEAARYLESLRDNFERGVIQQITTLIQQTMGNQQASIEHIATLLNTNKRTLQRRLKQKGVVFRQLLNQVRVETAKWYLSSSQMDITLLSELLGYTDVSNFSRAFHNSTGYSPSAWRRTT